MTDNELIRAAAERVMGWAVIPFHAKIEKKIYPALIENASHDWCLIADKRSWARKWNPLASDADAFMLVDAIHSRGEYWFRLTTRWDKVNWSAGWTTQECTGWNGRMDIEVTDPDRRRAIVLAALRAVGVDV